MALRSLAAPHPRFAALRALLRLLAPRHPPNALLRLAFLLCRLPFRASTSDLRIVRSHSDQAAPNMRTQFSSANKLARFGKIEAVITMRAMLVYSRIALSSRYVVVQERPPCFRNAPDGSAHLSTDACRGHVVLSEIAVAFEALTYIAIGRHMVSSGLATSSAKLVLIPQIGRPW